MPAAEKRWTVDEVRALPNDGKRHEVIDGVLWVTPAPAWRHQDVVLALARRLAAYVEEHRLGHVVLAPADVAFDRRTSVQPDLFVVPLVNGRKPRDFQEAGSLLLVTEVLSPSTARLDRGEKRELYHQRGVPVYWIVDPDARLVERWTPDDARPEIVRGVLTWRPSDAHPAFELDLPRFFAEFD